MAETRTFLVAEEDAPKRLDLFLTDSLKALTRSAVKGLIEEGRALVNGKKTKAGLRLKGGEEVSVDLPDPRPQILKAEDIPLDIIYEDNDIIVVNKQAGLAVHPGAGRPSGTLVNALLAHTQDLSDVGGPLRLGIVHRIDRDTTGSLVIAKNNLSHLALARQFKEHTTGRRYLALVWGAFKEDVGTIDLNIGRDSSERKKISTRTRRSRKAVTHWRVIGRYTFMTLLDLTLETGRTHQIRVHLSAINHPVVCDQVYGKRVAPASMDKAVADKLKGIKRQLLHARTLVIAHPATGEEMKFNAPLPPDMAEVLELLDSLQGT
ncbi:MAG: RNA pseudouridine synthase [Deltaproteobacteria bacterium GWB2_55_19]|nr:MAG: RNA pseudouridine synthase [Deltaproteobacteria bacterium GWB2_55_19]HAO94074.1 RluA family pseudouridine synthase [Deltaproteobacteria bacterium]